MNACAVNLFSAIGAGQYIHQAECLDTVIGIAFNQNDGMIAAT